MPAAAYRSTARSTTSIVRRQPRRKRHRPMISSRSGEPPYVRYLASVGRNSSTRRLSQQVRAQVPHLRFSLATYPTGDGHRRYSMAREALNEAVRIDLDEVVVEADLHVPDR